MYLEDFEPGKSYTTTGRTISEADSVLFSTITGAYNPLFLDEAYAAKTPFKTRIIPGLLTASFCTGLIYQLPCAPFGLGFVALVGCTVKWSRPVFIGNTIYTKMVVTDKRPLKDGRGLVSLKARVINEKDEEVLEIEYRIIVQSHLNLEAAQRLSQEADRCMRRGIATNPSV